MLFDMYLDYKDFLMCCVSKHFWLHCRHMFFLHIKEDLLSGNLQCSSEHAIELSALLAQMKFGDYNQNTAKYNYEELCAKELTTTILER